MTQDRYSGTAIVLHWLIAGALAFQYGLGEAMEHVARSARLDVAQFHKAIGITILILTLARVFIRFTSPRPAPMGDSGWAQKLAGITHWGLYAFMLLAPLTGWLASSTGRLNVPIDMFGLFHFPAFPGLGGMDPTALHGLHEFGEETHEAVAKLGFILFLLHIAGALRHQFLMRQRTIERMMGGNRTLTPMVGTAHIVGFTLVMAALMIWGRSGAAPAADPTIVQSVQAQLGAMPAEPTEKHESEKEE